jgi:hypothetical protein
MIFFQHTLPLLTMEILLNGDRAVTALDKVINDYP